MEKLAVKLHPKIARRGGGFVDPESGLGISVARQAKNGFQLVPATGFIRARINSGDLLSVEISQPKQQPKADEGKVEVVLVKGIKIDDTKFKAGEKLLLTTDQADKLIADGVAKMAGSDAP